jgi:hypothetical protein
MPIRHLVCVLLLSLLTAGCSRSPQSRAGSIAREVGVANLRADLQTLTASPAGQQHDIPPTAWPASVRRFHPLAVQRHMEGVLIILSRVGREQEGLVVMLDPRNDPGSGGSGVSYERLRRDGVFWCVEKIREPYIPPEERTNK